MQILKSEKHGVIVNRARDAESYHDMNKLAFINEQNQKQMNIIYDKSTYFLYQPFDKTQQQQQNGKNF